MRTRVAGFLLILILLVFAMPSALTCCRGPSGADKWQQRQHQVSAAAAVEAVAAVAVVQADPVDSSLPGSSARDCIDHAAAAQALYIEASGGSGKTAAPRMSSAIIDPSAPVPASAPLPARRYGVATNDSGPPLWLSTCVSRT
jgi:hypothetical protein